MAIYKFKAIDANGTVRAGELEASARHVVLSLLHQRGLVPIDVGDGAAVPSPAMRVIRVREALSALFTRTPLRPRQLVSLTHSLAALLNAGLTVDRALTIAAGLETAPAAGRFFADLAQAVRSGTSFTEALRMTGAALPTYYSSMVEAGELGGSLPQTLARVSELLQKQLDVRERIQSALIYPTLLACVVLGTLIILVGFVLPRFRTLFAESEAPLPWSTQVVLGIGELTSHYWWLMVGLLATSVVSAHTYASSAAGRRRIDRWLSESRLTFGLPASIQTARMLRTLSALLQNGVPLSSALRVSQGTLSNSWLRSAFEHVTRSVNAGEDFATSLAAARVFPREAIQLARVGEETGRLHELLTEAAAILETSSARTLERLLAMLVPALTVLMGLIVAGLIGSVLIGLLSINDLAS